MFVFHASEIWTKIVFSKQYQIFELFDKTSGFLKEVSVAETIL